MQPGKCVRRIVGGTIRGKGGWMWKVNRLKLFFFCPAYCIQRVLYTYYAYNITTRLPASCLLAKCKPSMEYIGITDFAETTANGTAHRTQRTNTHTRSLPYTHLHILFLSRSVFLLRLYLAGANKYQVLSEGMSFGSGWVPRGKERMIAHSRRWKGDGNVAKSSVKMCVALLLESLWFIFVCVVCCSHSLITHTDRWNAGRAWEVLHIHTDRDLAHTCEHNSGADK